MVRERRGAPGGGFAGDPERPSSGLPGCPGLCAGGVLQPRAPLRKVPGVRYPTVHTQQSSVPNGAAEHNVTVVCAFTKLMGAVGSKIHLLANPGQDVAPISVASRRTASWGQMQLGSLQYPCNPKKGASEHFHFLSVLAGTYDNTVRNIDIGRAGYLRHSFIAGFPTERVPKMPLSGVSTRSGNLARFTFKGLDGTMTDLFIHLVAYQPVTLSGTGVSALD